MWDLNPKQQSKPVLYPLFPALDMLGLSREHNARDLGYTSGGEEENKSNALQPHHSVYADDTQKQRRNPSSGSVLKDTQHTAGCGPGAYQGVMPMSPLTIRLQGSGASYAKCNMQR